ncbi:glycogen debranching enzyme N-terminal domain-containing protein [Desulfosarcina sp. OttesenSCG-928-A07]|nr:glycogen debranching enzyme N-terminal domain-containing protein [Desulfosarcina sp. OttesenSCG-928-G17]MDL2329238.1 glycogen debranching enzyme N-terminal domain-containing protein [Desulfosarcina sp. OttesenSCG-928-A07]
MIQTDSINQIPAPGSRQVCFAGDTIIFHLHVPADWEGEAWLRTNIGHARSVRQEIIRQVDEEENPLGRSWYDLPMKQADENMGHYTLTLALTEVGHFEAKGYFLKKNQTDPTWPPGINTTINVEPADTCCANIIYNAFVRQFGPNKSGAMVDMGNQAKPLDEAGYTVIPPSGTFRDLIRELDFIIGHLGCRIIQLLPIHPTPTTYGRMGRFGSPYAALSFTTVDPALAEFDPKATPMEQFGELVDAIHGRGARIFIDIAINHTGWAAGLHETHPQWLAREPDGQIEMPGAWGVIWADLTRLDYSHEDLWQYMAQVFLTWCRRGVDGFRCDAGYMIPTPAWRYIIGKVRNQFPGVIFLLEGLGGKISVTRDLLNWADFNWAYSELFQNYDRGQVEHYLPGALDISRSDGTVIHFAETHDNPRLAATSFIYAKMRTALCALLSDQGGFGFANGVEWLATEKIDVHGSPSLNWGAPENQVNPIRRLNAILSTHPAFFHPVRVEMIQNGPGNFIVVTRQHIPSGKSLLILVNLDTAAAITAVWPKASTPLKSGVWSDLLTGDPVVPHGDEDMFSLFLEPGQVFCLTDTPADLAPILETEANFPRIPARTLWQRLRNKALQVWRYYRYRKANDQDRGAGDLGDWDVDVKAGELKTSPLAFCREMNRNTNQGSTSPRTVVWRFPEDLKRDVMIPPEHFLLVQMDRPFRAVIFEEDTAMTVEDSLMDENGTHFALFIPLPTPVRHQVRTLSLSRYAKEGGTHHTAPLTYLAAGSRAGVRRIFFRFHHSRFPTLHMLGTNDRGAMSRAHADWTRLPGRYDALLAANLSSTVPENRRILFTRLRGWVVYQGFSQEISIDCLERFGVNADGLGCWEYHLPSGQGEHVVLRVSIRMIPDTNAVELIFYRQPAADHPERLADDKPVTLILRPDIEDRDFHTLTKAYAGPETLFPKSVAPRQKGFVFSPWSDHSLEMTALRTDFFHDAQWSYMVHHDQDAQRGQDPDSDLFSPGYFSGLLGGGNHEQIRAFVPPAPPVSPPADLLRKTVRFFETTEVWEPPIPALEAALSQYVVKRDQYATVIAGYPWFLDWGRDTLIVVRGIIAAGRHTEALSIIQQFAVFEQNGTIPNMIRGTDTGNRDTSDAPLWLFRVCDELGTAMGHKTVLETDCGGRPLKAVLLSIARSIMAGTPNGIVMDKNSGLVFSPAHFTWMDTNYPAGTPREGYPIEIQALWYAALDYLARVDEEKENAASWKALAEKVRRSIPDLFFRKDLGHLSDCLHAAPGTPAEKAIADDALRPNQLFALTLGAITDKALSESMLMACQSLLVPGAIRTLADRPVHPELAVYHNGKLVNNPRQPYVGGYGGDEDTSRKPAYHNGTAWTWVFPSFCEAWHLCFGEAEREAALSWLSSSTRLLNDGCVGHVPEIVDGDAPHHQRGCDAQAWGISELLRVWIDLMDTKSSSR